MDWVHCNTCFTVPSSKVQFNLTSCGHIFCSSCLQNKNADKVCKTCGQKYNGVVLLTNNMKPDVQMYFMDIKDLHKNILKQVQQTQLVAEFQKGHSQRLVNYQKQKLAKFSEMMFQAKELERKYREILHENEKFKQFLASKGFQIADIVGKSTSMFPKTPRTPVTPGNSRTPGPSINPRTPGPPINPRTPGVSVNPLMRSFSNSSMSSVTNKRPSTPSMQRGTRSLNHSISPMQQSPMNNRNLSTNPSPAGSISRSLQRTPHGPSPVNTSRQSSSMVAPGRITMRTPPVNGKIGPIASSPSLRNAALPSPNTNHHLSTPRLNISSQQRSGQTYYSRSTSKIGQNLCPTGSSPVSDTPTSKYISGTPLEERRPIQLNPTRSISYSTSS